MHFVYNCVLLVYSLCGWTLQERCTVLSGTARCVLQTVLVSKWMLYLWLQFHVNKLLKGAFLWEDWDEGQLSKITHIVADASTGPIVDSLVPLLHHDLSNFKLLILIRVYMDKQTTYIQWRAISGTSTAPLLYLLLPWEDCGGRLQTAQRQPNPGI